MSNKPKEKDLSDSEKETVYWLTHPRFNVITEPERRRLEQQGFLKKSKKKD